MGARVLTADERPEGRWQNIESPADWASDEMRNTTDYWKARYASGVRAFRAVTRLFTSSGRDSA